MDSRVFGMRLSLSSDDDEDTYHESVSLKRDGTNSTGINIFDEQTYVSHKPRSLAYPNSFSYVTQVQ